MTMLEIMPAMRPVAEPAGSVEKRPSQPWANPGTMKTASQHTTYSTTKAADKAHPKGTTLSSRCDVCLGCSAMMASLPEILDAITTVTLGQSDSHVLPV